MRLNTHSTKQIPLAASMISAGAGLEISEEYDLLDINYLITNGREGFISFTVTGNSMIDSIRPGDIVFVDTWAQPTNGNIVAACVNGLTCIKIYENKPTGLYLVSANKSYEPRRVTARDSLHVYGVVRGSLALY